MKKQISFFSVCILTTTLFFSHTGLAQDLEPGEVLPDLTQEQKIQHLTGILNAMVFAALNYRFDELSELYLDNAPLISPSRGSNRFDERAPLQCFHFYPFP